MNAAQRMHWRQRLIVGLFWLVLTVSACAVSLRGVSAIPLHIDESDWIALSRLLEPYATGDWAPEVWQPSKWTVNQPPVARYLIGISRRLGGYGPDDVTATWAFGASWEENVARGAVPSDDLLWWSRLPMALLMAGAIVLSAVGVAALAGRPAALLAAVLLMTHATLLEHLRRAMSEAPLVFGVAAGWLLLSRAIAVPDHRPGADRRRLGWLIAAGISAGVTTMAKLNGATLALALVGAAVLIGWNSAGTPLRRVLRAVVAASAALAAQALAAFVLYPYLWPNPVGRLQRMINRRAGELENQTRFFPDDTFLDLSDRISRLSRRLFETDAALPWLTFWPNLLLGLVALAVLVGLLRRRDHPAFPAAAALALTAVAAAGPPLLSPLDWTRYFVVPIWLVTLLTTIGALSLIQWPVRRHLLPDAAEVDAVQSEQHSGPQQVR